MLSPQTLTFLILAAALGALLTERLRADLVALLVVAALTLSGVLSPADAFAGFSGPVVITITSIFILAEGVRRTGLADQMGRLLLAASGRSEARLVAVVMLSGATLSLFMNNIAAASILLPAVSGAARRSSVSPSRLLMPLAFGTILGGMATLLTTTNLIVSGILQRHDLPGFGLLEFAPIGVPVAITGILWMALFGRRALPARALSDAPEADLVASYGLGARLFRARIPARSVLIGRDLAHCRLREEFGLSVVGIERTGRTIQAPPPSFVIVEDDVLVFEGDRGGFEARDVEPKLEILPQRDWRGTDFETGELIVIECMLAPRSRLIGLTLADARFRERTGMTVLAIWRGGRQLRENPLAPLGATKLQFGDALLLQGPRDRLAGLAADTDLILLTRGRDASPRLARRGWLALVILAGTLATAAFLPEMVSGVMLGGALAMVLTGLLSMDQAYQAIEWRTVFLVAGMLSAGVAMARSGAAADLSGGIVAAIGGYGAFALFAAFFLSAVLLTQAMPGAAVAAIVAPLAIEAALATGASAHVFALGVALATSMAFLTPLGHPVNALVMGPGGYRVREFFKAGLPLALLLSALILLLVPRLWSLT